MKKKTANATISYDPVVISEETTISFTKSTNALGTTIYGRVLKNSVDAGTVAYDGKGNYLNLSLKPYDLLTQEEISEVYAQVPQCVREMLADA